MGILACGLCTVFVPAKAPFNRFNQITAGGVKARENARYEVRIRFKIEL